MRLGAVVAIEVGAARWTSRPKGVQATIVNGVPIVLDGELQADAGLPGQVLAPTGRIV